MLSFILDTDTLSLWQRGHPKVIAQAALRSPTELAIAIISVEEQFLGRINVIRKQTRSDLLSKAYESFTTTVFWLRRLEIASYSDAAIN